MSSMFILKFIFGSKQDNLPKSVVTNVKIIPWVAVGYVSELLKWQLIDYRED